MTRIIVDETLRNKLHNLSEPLELCDESGRLLAQLFPILDLSEYEPCEPPISEEELRRLIRDPQALHRWPGARMPAFDSNDLPDRELAEAFLARHLGGRSQPIGDDFAGSGGAGFAHQMSGNHERLLVRERDALALPQRGESSIESGRAMASCRAGRAPNIRSIPTR